MARELETDNNSPDKQIFVRVNYTDGTFDESPLYSRQSKKNVEPLKQKKIAEILCDGYKLKSFKGPFPHGSVNEWTFDEVQGPDVISVVAIEHGDK